MKKTSSTGKTENPIWKFFSSVKLAVILFIILAVTSIIGTVLPQGESLQFYLERYGPGVFKLIRGLHLYDTYHSWWYTSLLVLFSVNLTVCISRRLPFTLKLYRRDNLDVDAGRLLRMPFRERWILNPGIAPDAEAELQNRFARHVRGRVRTRDISGDGKVFLSEKGKWSYWGLYGLHSSLLIIFVGALAGTFWGFGGSLMLAEGESADHVVSRELEKKIPLGFSIRCDKFTVQFYDTGAPKEFRSDVTVIDDGREVLHKKLRVNSPLVYKGIRFYQSSYQAIPDITVNLVSSDGRQHSMTMPAYRKVAWPEAGLEMGVMRYVPNIHGSPAIRLWIGSSAGGAQAVWVLRDRQGEYNDGRNLYRISLAGIKEKYMTGLQVKKDPGVPLVWLGCAGLILGIFVAFWVPHRRMWLYVGRKENGTEVILAGQSNKNKIAFGKHFDALRASISEHLGEP